MLQPMKAKFGISLSNRAVMFGWATTDDLIQAAKIAEESHHFHGVWVGDNLLSKPRIESVVTRSAIAAHTRIVKLGRGHAHRPRPFASLRMTYRFILLGALTEP